MSEWWSDAAPELIDERPSVWAAGERQGVSVRLHPGTDPVVITVEGDGRVRVSIPRTSAVGPGYHSTALSLVRRFFSEQPIEGQAVEDQAANGGSGRWEHLCEAFIADRRAMCRVALHQAPNRLAAWHFTDRVFQALPGEAVHTRMGPMTRDRLDLLLINDDAVAASFPWWAEAQDGAYHLRRALCWLWVDCRWRRSVETERFNLLGCMNHLGDASTLGATGIP